ncbi:MAG TPA: GNAT family protein [Syntrophomonadaceae bacterium]|nr:GNAT family N-acetyltransferase [Syntrophomonadaceae bacterium]HOQ08844.1 GNAT family protein [Syntrophomonadaceae bacterium]HPU47655.1 GNAT family protein [Syntrophomonadaceae bacterium]
MRTQTIYIKDRFVTVRPASPEDAVSWLQYLRQVGDETDFLAFCSEQVTLTTHEARRYLDYVSRRHDNLFLLAADTTRIIGSLNFQRGRWPFTRHQGEFGISVLAEFWGYGLARRMMEIMMQWARSNDIKKINLKVRTDNIRAIKLYQSMGFAIEGTIEREFFRPGVFYSAYHMGLKL